MKDNRSKVISNDVLCDISSTLSIEDSSHTFKSVIVSLPYCVRKLTLQHSHLRLRSISNRRTPPPLASHSEVG